MIGVVQADLRYPDVRRTIIDRLRGFTDEAQQQEWARHGWAFYDAVNDLDHFVLEPSARSGVGVVFYSDAEADAAGAAVEQLLAVLDDVGPSATYPDVQAHKQWPSVVAAVRAALSVIDSR